MPAKLKRDPEAERLRVLKVLANHNAHLELHNDHLIQSFIAAGEAEVVSVYKSWWGHGPTEHTVSVVRLTQKGREALARGSKNPSR